MLSCEDRPLVEEVAELKSMINVLQHRVAALEQSTTVQSKNQTSLTELRVLLEELVTWRKTSESRMAEQGEAILKATMMLDHIAQRQEKHSAAIEKLKNNSIQQDKDGSITFNEILKKLFWMGLGLLITLITKER